MPTEIADSAIDTDLVAGRFGGADKFMPLPKLISYSDIITQPNTAYNFRRTDALKLIKCTSADATTLTVLANASVPIDTLQWIAVLQHGAGAVTIEAGVGVTIRTASTLVLAAQYAVATLLKIDTNEWLLSGYLEAA